MATDDIHFRDTYEDAPTALEYISEICMFTLTFIFELGIIILKELSI